MTASHDVPLELLIGFTAGWLLAAFFYAYLGSLRHKKREKPDEE